MDINDLIQEGNSFRFSKTDFDERINDSVKYAKWKEKCKRYLSINYKGDKYIESFEEKCNEYENNYTHNELVGMLEAFREMPILILKPIENGKVSGTVVNVHQLQTQSQEIAIYIFLEAIKDELTGKQLKEIKSIVAEEFEPEKAKSKVMEKLKSFGEDVLSNIVANVITNPSIWGGF